MNADFEEHFEKFQHKIRRFMHDHDFETKTQEYNALFNQMASVAPDDMKPYIERAPDFLHYRNESLALMERIVEIHNNLERIFQLESSALALECGGDLEALDTRIGNDIHESARLLHRFHEVSEKGRALIEKLDDPFLSQGRESDVHRQ